MRGNTLQAVQSCHDLLRWLIPLFDQFPRTRRFKLGECLEVRSTNANCIARMERGEIRD